MSCPLPGASVSTSVKTDGFVWVLLAGFLSSLSPPFLDRSVVGGRWKSGRAQIADTDSASLGVRPLRGCPRFGVSRRRPGANRFRRDLGVAPPSFGFRPCGRRVRESDRLHAKSEFGAEADRIHAMLDCAGETDRPPTVLESITGATKPGKLLEVRSVGRSARVERVQRAEAGFKRSSCKASPRVDSSCDSLCATRVESPSSRVQRVNAALLEDSRSRNSHARMHENSLARSLHGLHDGRFVLNSHNPVGDGDVRGRSVCVLRGTKGSSTNTLNQVGCPAGREACCSSAGAIKVARGDVGRLQTGFRPEDFPGGGNRSGVCCFGDLSFLSFLTHLSHLGQAELLGTCWAVHWRRKQCGLGFGCSGIP